MIMALAKSILNEVAGTNQYDNLFERNYICLRDKENRIYTDGELKLLPDISPDHIYYKEWLIRKRSCMKFISYLKSKKTALHILDVGCGNGWFSNQLTGIAESNVMGTDINRTELRQAARTFSYNPRLKFSYGDVRSGILEKMRFDVIVFAASIQYFSSLTDILDCASDHLNMNGEIHLVDTPFYKQQDLAAAKERTEHYFYSLGFPAMADFYFHHSTDELKRYHYTLLYNPDSLKNKFTKNHNPFPWICIKKFKN